MKAVNAEPGARIHRWTFIRPDVEQTYRGRNRRTWVVRCDCGVERVKREQDIVYGHSKSCGCQRVDSARAQKTHGMSHRRPGGSPTYNTWALMLQRCTNPKNTNYKRYGARGITVCERWRTFANFLADMGERPPGTSIERLDVDGHYDPGNCCWATRKEQARNTSRNVLERHEPDQIRWLRNEGVGARAIARLLGVTSGAVGYVYYGGGWT